MNRFVILSGCSGGGKSTLLAALAARGHATIEEPGRRIVAEEQAGDGKALPWIDLAAFARRAIAMAVNDRERARNLPGFVFFDRSLIDAAAALATAASDDAILQSLKTEHRYHNKVFLTPPWPEIYRQDSERRHDLGAAEDEYRHLLEVYPTLGYETVVLPKMGVVERVEFILKRLEI